MPTVHNCLQIVLDVCNVITRKTKSCEFNANPGITSQIDKLIIMIKIIEYIKHPSVNNAIWKHTLKHFLKRRHIFACVSTIIRSVAGHLL